MLYYTDEDFLRHINNSLCTFIYKYRMEHDLTVDDFLARAGLGSKYIYNLSPDNKGVPRDIRISSLIKIARMNNMTLDDFIQHLLYEKDKKNKLGD